MFFSMKFSLKTETCLAWCLYHTTAPVGDTAGSGHRFEKQLDTQCFMELEMRRRKLTHMRLWGTEKERFTERESESKIKREETDKDSNPWPTGRGGWREIEEKQTGPFPQEHQPHLHMSVLDVSVCFCASASSLLILFWHYLPTFLVEPSAWPLWNSFSVSEGDPSPRFLNKALTFK
jgi:hypothetical protein